VPYISGPPIAPGKFARLQLPGPARGHTLDAFAFRASEQNLLAAPLIVREQSAIRSACKRS